MDTPFGGERQQEAGELFRVIAAMVLAAQMVKNPPAVQETQVGSLGWEDPWRREWQPTPVFLPGESHGQRRLARYSPRGRKESHTTEQLTLSLSPEMTAESVDLIYPSV